MQKQCTQCSEQFTISEKEKQFMQQIHVPDPTQCPQCRYIRRHGWINDYCFWTRECDNCSERFVSIYSPNFDGVVYCQRCWYSEDRDGKSMGMDWDPNRSFFEQFADLIKVAPRLGIIGQFNENSDYCESVANCKNCYLISECSNCEDCAYSYWIQKSKDCYECNYTNDSERCYECENCFSCTRLRYSKDCEDCHDSAFLDNCHNCKNCLLCTNLRQKEYCVLNEQLSRDEYKKRKKELNLHSHASVAGAQKAFESFLLQQPRRALQITNAENCSGNYVQRAKNCANVYHCYDAEECAHGEHIWRGAKYCMHCNSVGRDAELGYETTNSGINSYNLKFARYCWGCRDSEYCDQCKQGKNLFGCISLKPSAQYCVLNKQYSESDWKDLVSRIKEKMLADGEYGEFFPLSLSPFGYNHTVSGDAFPLTKEEAQKKGFLWDDATMGTAGKGTLDTVPDDIHAVDVSITDQVLTCEATGENYKIGIQELDFYKEEEIPIPQKCPARRLRDRLKLHAPPMQLYTRKCVKCSKEIETSYAPDGPEIVYCESCYLSEIY